MFIPRLYFPYPLAVNETLTLDKEKSHYLVTVLRLNNDEKVILFNGDAGEYQGRIQLEKKIVKIHLDVFLPVVRESALEIHLGQGLIRGDRMDYVMQKATELGVSSIQPISCATSSVKLDKERSEKRLAHWQSIAVSAAEQSGRTQVPTIYQPITLNEWLKQAFDGLSIVFDLEATQSLKTLSKPQRLRVAIGPESGWIDSEVALMKNAGFTDCLLGPRILRTETAPVVALSILQSLFGDL